MEIENLKYHAWNGDRVIVNTPVSKTRVGQNKGWSKQGLVKTRVGQNKGWSKQGLVKPRVGQNKGWSILR